MLARAVYRATLRGVHQIKKSGHPLQLSPPVTSEEWGTHTRLTPAELEEQREDVFPWAPADACGEAGALATFLGANEESGANLFAYRLRIKNERDDTVQLRSRHWVIADEDGAEDEVVPKGSHGVVGQTPTLAPGAEFQYASGTELRGPKGAIRGSFEFVSVGDGSTFEAEAVMLLLAGPAAPAYAARPALFTQRRSSGDVFNTVLKSARPHDVAVACRTRCRARRKGYGSTLDNAGLERPLVLFECSGGDVYKRSRRRRRARDGGAAPLNYPEAPVLAAHGASLLAPGGARAAAAAALPDATHRRRRRRESFRGGRGVPFEPEARSAALEAIARDLIHAGAAPSGPRTSGPSPRVPVRGGPPRLSVLDGMITLELARLPGVADELLVSPAFVACVEKRGLTYELRPGGERNRGASAVLGAVVREPLARFVSGMRETLRRLFDAPDGAPTLADAARQATWPLTAYAASRHDADLGDLVRAYAADFACLRRFPGDERVRSQSSLLQAAARGGKAGFAHFKVFRYEALMANAAAPSNATGAKKRTERIEAVAGECLRAVAEDGDAEAGGAPSESALLAALEAAPDVLALLCATLAHDFVCLGYDFPPACAAFQARGVACGGPKDACYAEPKCRRKGDNPWARLKEASCDPQRPGYMGRGHSCWISVDCSVAKRAAATEAPEEDNCTCADYGL
ncbi:hypothetical protein JL722_4717 [Aureococcus anophagefferens]|nr:hypothetical protein JL722_4717 [Aureococcus anophagefferens]